MSPEVNTQLEETLTNVLSWAEAASTTANEFIVEQTPLVVQEMITWTQIMGILSVGTWLAIVILSVSSLLIGWKIGNRVDWENNDMTAGVFFTLLFFGISILSGIASIVCFFDTVVPKVTTAIQATFTPRLFIIDQLTDLLNKI